MKKTRKKLLTGIIAVMLIVTTVPIYMDSVTDAVEKEDYIIYDYAYQSPGLAYGTITVSTSEAGSYQLYWADKDGNKLKYNGVEFTEITDITTTESNQTTEYKVPSPYTVIPDGAEQLILLNNQSETVCNYVIPENKKFDEGEAKYSFALMSDVHYNRYPEENGEQDDSVEAFDNALKFVNDQGIDFVGLTGDLSNQGEDLAYTKFNTAIEKYPDITVYTCMGNHDVSWTGSAETHVKLFANQINKNRTSDKNVKEIDSNGVDFVYEKNGDIFIFFSQTKANYNKYTYLVSKEQMTWLEKVLNKYAEYNVYLFFHTYFASDNGDVTTAVGNLQNPGGYTYDLTYVYGNPSEVRMRKILNKYPNVTMFNGHSHWAYDQQKYNPNLNIGNINSNKTGASLVHLSSVSAPRTIEENATKREENNGKLSQGTIAVKYNSSTVYLSTDFVTGKYLAYAAYINQDGAKSTPEDAIKVGASKIKSVGKVKKVSKKSKKYKVNVKYKQVSKAYKYEIQYSNSKIFKSSKTKTRRTNKTIYTISGLKNRKTYYIRVRAYTYQFGERVYGKWSAKKTVKINKKK